MKRLLALVCLCAAMSFATTSISVGNSMSQGFVGVEQTFKDDHLGVNAHLSAIAYNRDEFLNFQLGLGLTYRFNGLTGPYVFHSSDWIHDESVNYWSLIFGVGYQHMFSKHFGLYFEAGSGFIAGDGGYYLHYDKKAGRLDNERFGIDGGVGLKISF